MARLHDGIVIAIIISFGLIVGGLLIGGRYHIVLVNQVSVARIDRWSGDVSLCVFTQDVKVVCRGRSEIDQSVGG